ncbi:cobalamin B12-binding domain-containing protein [Yoonia sp.]|uniref:cobalamin B12-binding domain-containing protein n=1 Tax=Yoonia sp. TaxID=2212373 RepID=UPI002FD91BAA
MTEDAFDRVEYERAGEQFRLFNRDLPDTAVVSVAREVVRRLAFRMPRETHENILPTPAEVERLCDALLDHDSDTAESIILDARRDGVPVETIYLGYVAATARRLGDLWNGDQISFVEATLASGKLFRIVRGLRRIVANSILADRDERPAMFALVPGESHSLGIEIATDIFRRNNWEIDMMVGLDHDTLVDRADNRHYRAIVLVANSENLIESLTRLVLALRISHPLAFIVVAGNIVDLHPDIEMLVGADDVIKDIETAVTRLKDLVEEPVA